MEPNINKSGDDININIKISRSFISSQVAIIFGCLALWLFSGKAAMKGLIIVALLLDVVAIIMYFLSKHAAVDDGDVPPPAEPEKNTTEETTEKVEVEHKGKNKQAVKDTDGVIKNKVPIPNPTSNNGFAEPNPSVNEGEKDPVNLNGNMETDWGQFY